MAVTHYRFIDPKVLASIGSLPLAARAVVDGFMYGIHPSRMPGAGLEFSQYRSYQAGDDLRRVDWKLYARSDRYFVRESEIETSLTVRLVIDASASMAHGGTFSKFDYARFVAAALAVLAHRQGDGVGLFALNDGALRAIRPGRGQAHLHRLLHELETIEPAGAWPDWSRVEGALTVGGVRGITVVVTDLHERAGEIRSAVVKLAAMRHEVIVLHVVAPEELNLGYDGPVELEELETGRVLDVDPDAERAMYVTAVEAEHTQLRRALQERSIGYARLSLAEPLDGALRAFLAARVRAAGAR
ncbi:MAG: DUF58 domain-containing protein [Gemmatimonadota bacterium]